MRAAVLRIVGLVVACVLISHSSARAETADFANERIQLLERIQQEPNDASAFADLATWLFRDAQLERAVAAAEEAVRLAPDVARYHRLAGYLHAAVGAEQKAEASFTRAAELDPSSRSSLADFRLAQAWAEYDDAVRGSRPDDPVVERVRRLAALAENSPELKMLVQTHRQPEAVATDEVPPIFLADAVDSALVVEKRSQTLRLYRRSGTNLALVRMYPCTTGRGLGAKERRGDRRTPDGVYVVSNLLQRNRLPGRYGALAMPISYPNAWDRQRGRNGYGIWFHGSDRLGSPFTPRDTKGCVIVRNEDLVELARIVTPGVTPVLIAEDIAYRPAAEWQAAVRAILRDVPTVDLLAVVAGAEYTVAMHRDKADVVREFIEAGERWRVVATERAALMPAPEWHAKVAAVLPANPVQLQSVRIADDGQPPHIVIETSGSAEAHGFQPELADRLYVDLPGVRTGPMPTLVPGGGAWVKAVRIAPAQLDPPSTRLVIDLREPMGYRVQNEGNRIVVSLVKATP